MYISLCAIRGIAPPFGGRDAPYTFGAVPDADLSHIERELFMVFDFKPYFGKCDGSFC
jgi:hypothetical protein